MREQKDKERRKRKREGEGDCKSTRDPHAEVSTVGRHYENVYIYTGEPVQTLDA